MKNSLYPLFLEPTNEYRGKPFWSWNGKLDKQELLRQLHVFKDMGFGGFFMHSRTGLVTEYLSDEWFDLINACAEEAERLGMEAWLYDEDRWPSGTAGGLVTKEPEYRLKFLRLKVVSSYQLKWSDDTVAVFSCQLDGMEATDIQQLKPDEIPKNKTILHFTVEEMEKESFYNGYTYLDTLNKQATEKFLEMTHEKYKSHSGKHLGKAIKGVFTDEPHRGSLMDGFGIENEDKAWLAPWTYDLFNNFQKKYGYDLVSKLPELFLQVEGKRISQVKWHYVDLLQEMFIENFAKPMYDWCRENDLILTGHVLHEDSLTAQTAMSGSVMRYYEHMDYPGVDILTEGNVNYWVVKQLSSAARQTGKKWLLSELYGCTGWQMSFENHKQVGDWQALFGINLRCHHLSWYTMEGEAKRDFPASISHQSAWWQDYEYVETYFSRLGVAMTNGEPDCDVLVINPVESLWCQIYPGWSENLSAKSAAVKKIEEKHQTLFHWLAGAHIDFDYGDEEMLGRLYRVDKSTNEPSLHIGNASYKTVIISWMTTIRKTTLDILTAFIEAGGKVIFTDEPPAYVDAVKSEYSLRVAEKAIQIPFLKDKLVQTLSRIKKPFVEVLDMVTEQPMEDIFCQVRIDKEKKYVLLMNVDRKKSFENVRIIFNDQQNSIEEWDAVSGEKDYVPFYMDQNRMIIDTNFVPSGEHLYVISAEEKEQPRRSEKKVEKVIGSFEGSYSYILSEDNVCVLDRASYQIGEAGWQKENEILKVDQEIRKTLKMRLRGGEMIQPWYADKYGDAMESVTHLLKLRFPFSIQEKPHKQLHLVMERPDLFKTSINGKVIERKDHLETWIDNSFKRLFIPLEYLSVGENFIELETEFHQGINLEAIYLIGQFGVSIRERRNSLTKLPAKIEIGDLTEQGFPFYSGVITYQLHYQQIEKLFGTKSYLPDEKEKFLLSFSEFEAACLKIRSTGQKTRMVAWQPYTADITEEVQNRRNFNIEVVLTRRNTFGPLHLNPVHSPAYGPEHFVTEREAFSDRYMLIPSGLLEPPQLKKQMNV